MTNPYPSGPQGGGPEGWQQPPSFPYAGPSYPQSGQYPPQSEQYSQGAPYQQPYPYEQPQFYPPPKKRSRVWIYISLAVALTVLLSVGTFFLIRSFQSKPAGNTAATSTRKQSATTTPALPPEPGHSRPGPNTPPGWQSVGAPNGLDYDVPGDWTVQKPGIVIGWEKPCPDGPFGYCVFRSLRNNATLAHPLQEGCTDSSYSALAGFPASNPKEIPEAERQTIADALEAEARRVPDIYTDWAEDASAPSPPPIKRSDVRQFKIGNTPALQTSFTVTGLNTAVNCNPPNSVYTVVATTVPMGSVVTFVVMLGQGYPQAPDPGIAQKIIDTLRFEQK